MVEDSFRRRGRAGRIVLMLLAAVVLAAGLWLWFALSWAYSEGEHAGTLQKFSRQGWVCKTYEGELALYVVAGVAPQIWKFSTRDPAVAEKLSKVVGQRIQLHYSEHRGIPTSCFAETAYFADGFTVVKE
ncbi:MAG TPA: hypothetical protein VGN07_12930 [Steroidobacteraceae bacterium]|jgi:hypothetical protein